MRSARALETTSRRQRRIQALDTPPGSVVAGLPGQEAAAQHFRNGWSVLPLGEGEDGKKPSVGFKTAFRHPLRTVQERMRTLGTDMYALRLDGVVVVDADTDNEETREYIAERFGASPFQTATGRGIHHFWQLGAGGLPAPIRKPGIAIDIKSGANSYVVGPGSIRPDGVEYRSLGEALPSPDALPILVDRHAALQSAKALGSGIPAQPIPIGHRNAFLHKRAVAYAKTAESVEDLRAELAAARAYFCEDPGSITDTEIDGIAKWAWGLRLRNSLYGGRHSVYHVNRTANDTLLPIPGGINAFAVFCFLTDTWGHQPDKAFAVVPKAIAASGRLKMGKNQIGDAIRLLLQTNFLVLVRRSRGRGSPHLYLLGKGERVSNYIVPFSGDTKGA